MSLPTDAVSSIMSTQGILTATLTFVATIHFARDWSTTSRSLFKTLELLTTSSILILGFSAAFVVNETAYTQYPVVAWVTVATLLSLSTYVLMFVSIIILVFGLWRG